MPCDNCDCWECRTAREEADLAAKWAARCDQWNWNKHPIEIAKELKSEGIDNDSEEFEAMLTAVKKYFNEETAAQIEEVCDYLF